jgi:thymidylate kinase
MLTSLQEFGPEIKQNKYFQKWWKRMLKHWTSLLDIVIWLDAPNSILVKRIKARDTWHIVKEKPGQEMHNFLIRYRTSFEQVISMSKTHNNSLRILHFDTEHETQERITDKILHACGMQFKDEKLMTVNK